MATMKKWSINQGLRSFSKWFDEFILEVAKPLAILGFAMGTVDIFTRGGIATAPWFNVPWAVVQALTIDGLFFSVWYRLFNTKWTWNKAGANTLLVFIGLVLSVVTITTNGILSLQQLMGIPDSVHAMAWLGIDPIAFTVARAFLVVFVSVMVAFVYHQNTGTEQKKNSAEQSQNKVEQLQNSLVPVAEQWNTDWNTAAPEWNNWTIPLFSDLFWIEHLTLGGTVVTEQVEQPLLLAEHAEQTDRDKVRIALTARKRHNDPINLVEVAGETGVLYSRVRKLAPTIKRELGI